jgi:hypothetical protein
MGGACSSTAPSGSEDPSHRTSAPTAHWARSLWERPSPRHGRGRPPASMQAAVGVKTPPTETPAQAQAVDRAHALWEWPWPRHGRRRPPASMQAAVGVKTPPTETPAQAQAVDRAHPLWERPWPRHGRGRPPASMQAAVGVKTPPTESRPGLRPWIGRMPCGSGLGRDTADAICRLRFRLMPGQEAPSVLNGSARSDLVSRRRRRRPGTARRCSRSG